MKHERPLRIGQSLAMEEAVAIDELHAQLTGEAPALVIFFCSASYDLALLATEINRRFAGIPVIGCTAAGTIGPLGYGESGVSGIAFAAADFTVECGHFDKLQEFEVDAGRDRALELMLRLRERREVESGCGYFALSLIDGLSMREEQVAMALQDGLGGIHVIGASAGDDLRFQRTQVFHDGRFHDDAAVFAVLATRLPFRSLRTQHFVADGECLVVTDVDSEHRVVREFNGLPAVDEYARLIGVKPAQLNPVRFAARPVVVKIDGQDYVRAIRSANRDGSLTFFCALDEGVVLRVAHGQDLLGNLASALDEVQAEVGAVAGVLIFDCVLRALEIARAGQQEAVGAMLQASPAVGLSTYGEQCDGVHINQTLTGLVIGERRGGDE
ncbi:FIST N-terminal domain-containing protein [Azonexus caeni]|jgi:hypothetical protein|uniref:FIST N-terminal domain-containing protein n=1 Tax=Azonexus caeni TaxID=266126 RepID=UPI003A8BA6F3